MSVEVFVKLGLGATLLVLTAAVASDGARAKLVNPATEDRNATWMAANMAARTQAQPKLAYYLRSARPRSREVALTFDDAPRPTTTEALMDVLKSKHAPATFFMIGKQVERFPSVVGEIATNGFTLANHSYSHVTLTKIPFADVVTEYEACNNAVFNLIGKPMEYCRPPGGDVNKLVERAATAAGLKTVLWTDDPADYTEPGEKVIEYRTLANLGNGGIILLHDGVQQTVNCLPHLIDAIRAKGFKIVPIEDLPVRRA